MPDDGPPTPKAPTPKGSFGAFVSKKVGPLPVWAWTAMGVVALAIFLRMRAAKAAAASAGVDASAGANTGQAGDLTMIPAELTPEAGWMPTSNTFYQNVTVQDTPGVTPPAPVETKPSNYVPAEWQAGATGVHVARPGVGVPIEEVAKRALSSNMFNNPFNIRAMVQAIRDANPSIWSPGNRARWVGGSQAITIPVVPGLNSPGTLPQNLAAAGMQPVPYSSGSVLGGVPPNNPPGVG